MKERKGSLLQRVLAVLLAAVLVVGMASNAAPMTVLANEPGGQPDIADKHIHKICAGSDCTDDSHTDVEWTALTCADGKLYAGGTEIRPAGYGNQLPAGNYYLAEDLTLNEQVTVMEAEVNLCLNGNSLNSRIWIYDDGVLTLCDCGVGGKINNTNGTALGIWPHSGHEHSFTMYGGSLIGSTSGLSVTDEGGVVKLLGGTVSGSETDIEVKKLKRRMEDTSEGSICKGFDTPIMIGQSVASGTKMKVGWSWYEEDWGELPDVPVIKAAEGYTITERDMANLDITVTASNYTDTNFKKKIENGQIMLVPHAHTLVHHTAVAATCEEAGTEEYWKCEGTDGCGNMFSDGEGKNPIEKEPTTPKTGHSYDNSKWGYQAAEGHAHNCQNCDAHDAVQPHTPGAAATESTPQTCTVCGYIIAPAIGHTHNYGEWQHDNTQHWKACSCGEEINRNNHDYGDWITDQEATATNAGTKHRECLTCGYRETESIPATGTGTGTPEPTVTPPAQPTVTPPSEPTVTPSSQPTVTPPVQPTNSPKPDESGQTGNQIEKRKDLSLLLATGKQSGKRGVKLSWTKCKNISGYEVYWSYCDGKNNYKIAKTIKAAGKQTWTHKNLKTNRTYKYFIVTYKMVDGNKYYIARSPAIHVAMKYDKQTNVRKIKVNKSKITLKKGKTFQIKTKLRLENRKKKVLSHVAKLRYYTDNSKVAVVSAKGKISAKRKGKCTIYVIANNGVSKKMKVTVK